MPCYAMLLGRAELDQAQPSTQFMVSSPRHPIASGREEPAPRLGKTVELGLLMWVRVSQTGFSEWAGWSSAGEDMVGVDSGEKLVSWLVRPPDTQARIEMWVDPTQHHLWTEQEQGMILQMQTLQELHDTRQWWECLGKTWWEPTVDGYRGQRPLTRPWFLVMNTCKWRGKTGKTKGWRHVSFHNEIPSLPPPLSFISLLFCFVGLFWFLVFLLNFVLWGRLQGQRSDVGWEDGQDWDAQCENRKEPIKVF